MAAVVEVIAVATAVTEDVVIEEKTMLENPIKSDGTLAALKRLDALLEYAVQHGELEEAERIRKQLSDFADKVC